LPTPSSVHAIGPSRNPARRSPSCSPSPLWAASAESPPAAPCSAQSQWPALPTAHRALPPARGRSLRAQIPPPPLTAICPRAYPPAPFPASLVPLDPASLSPFARSHSMGCRERITRVPDSHVCTCYP
jgi:hypothetical protein